MKKLLKYAGLSLLGLIVLILVYLGCAWCLSRITVKAEMATQKNIPIYLRSNGVHMDIVMPVRTALKDWSLDLPFQDTRSGDTSYQYLAFGWGDRGFYLETPTWSDLKASTAFKAAFGLGKTAIHTTYYYNMEENEKCIRLYVNNDQLQRLIHYIEKSLQTGTNGKPIVIPTEARYGQHDAFYEAKGTYSLFHTCNTWTNNALKASGQKACWWTPFDKGIFYQYRH
ncbi:MAG: TIGR02117 family protein [Chitinophagaceae bacterium]|nr:MAG: TIGR02117 family protein [Chitinophagaceae bacterium]